MILLGSLLGIYWLWNRQSPSIPLTALTEIAKPHLLKASLLCEADIDQRLKALDAFFLQAKKGVPDFVDYALGYGSKRRWLQDRLPFTSGDRHPEFLRAKFEERIFKPVDLERELQRVVELFLADMKSREGQMLVDIRADIADLPAEKNLRSVDPELLAIQFNEAMKKAMQSSQNDLQIQLGSVVAAEIGGIVLRQVLVRMGILGVGASSGVVTLGIGLLAGLIVDGIVSWLWDAKSNLAQDLNRKLDEIRNLIVEGDETVEGLRVRLHRGLQERITLWTLAIQQLDKTHEGR
jgi:hypothetical protein